MGGRNSVGFLAKLLVGQVLGAVSCLVRDRVEQVAVHLIPERTLGPGLPLSMIDMPRKGG